MYIQERLVFFIIIISGSSFIIFLFLYYAFSVSWENHIFKGTRAVSKGFFLFFILFSVPDCGKLLGVAGALTFHDDFVSQT